MPEAKRRHRRPAKTTAATGDLLEEHDVKGTTDRGTAAKASEPVVRSVGAQIDILPPLKSSYAKKPAQHSSGDSASTAVKMCARACMACYLCDHAVNQKHTQVASTADWHLVSPLTILD